MLINPLITTESLPARAARETRAANMELMRQFLRESPHLNSQQISQRFRSIGVQLGDSSIRKYRKELGV
jgi:hypothetical protein